ncbi:MAG: hypothetical protein K0R90_629 [Oscillospiraceae bacterium]|jgi:hypothetical protein|nr:hypothetical protein [Oscillospiraceae bacterium]
MKKTKQILCGLISIILLFTIIMQAVCAQPVKHLYSEQEILKVAEDIINWKKSDNKSSVNGYLLNDAFLELAGTTAGDWFPIGLGRFAYQDDEEGYLAVIKEAVQKRYGQAEKLSAAKATEWHRISLSVLAMGGDPTHCGTYKDGNSINLIADGTYNRGKTAPLGKQGINGWIWGLIALDSMRYEIPKGSFYSRDDIITEIIKRQLSDGGFALSGKVSDPDVTAMAIQALSPYYNAEKSYTYNQKSDNKQMQKSVRNIIDEALVCLSKMQLADGDFASWGTQNAESTAQVIVAICSLGIDVQQDNRFIKNGNTLLDGIMKYRMKDGGFIHSLAYQADNPTSLPNKSNSMASEQVLYTMAAVWRQQNGMRILYDFRAEQSTALRKRISNLKSKISSITNKTSKSDIEKLLKDYYSLSESERNYVFNYVKLSDVAKGLEINILQLANKTAVIPDKGEEDGYLPVYFILSDRIAVSSLPKPLTTKQYVEVVKLLTKLEQSENFDEKETYRQILLNAKNDILAIQNEIDSINAQVKNKLYPFDKISLKDKAVVDDIVNRYKKLSEYDGQKIERYEDVLKTKTKVDNYLRAVIITVVLILVVSILLILVALHIRKRRTKKRHEMEQLEKLYEDE